MPPLSTNPNPDALILRPPLCRLGSPVGVGMPVFSIVSRRLVGVAKLLPSSPWPPVSPSRTDMENDMDGPWLWLCIVPLMELLGRASRPSIPPIDPDG